MTIKGHLIVRLSDLITNFTDEDGEIDKEQIHNILGDFYCPHNKDVEMFLHEKALLFNQQSIARTHLVMLQKKGKLILAGYFALALKTFVVKNNDDTKLSKNLRRRVGNFGQYNNELLQWTISAPLIGQLGKNYKYDNIIDGATLLRYACEEVKKAQVIVGGKFVYLECEDKPKLISFYEDNGFVDFGRRKLEPDEKDSLCGTELVQLLKYLK